MPYSVILDCKLWVKMSNRKEKNSQIELINYFIYDRIITMRKLFTNKFKLISLLSLSLALVACSIFLLLPKANSLAVNAEQSEYHLPCSSLEYKALSSPVDVYYSEDLTVIAQNYQLFVYKDGEYIDTSALSFTSLKQVKRLSETELLVLDYGNVYKVDVVEMKKTPLLDTSNEQIGSNYFDINDEYLVTAFGNDSFVYKISGSTYVKTSQNYTVKPDFPIAINENNQIFFVDSTGICSATAGKASTKSTVYNANPSKMIANGEAVYYIENSKIYTIDIATKSKCDLEFSNLDDDYTLGSAIGSPMGLSFKGKNLLITDASSVQEFKIESNKLIFTGFAIARNRSAFNRIGTTASKVEKYGDTVAVLDEYKLTVFYNASSEYYSRDNFDNFLADDLGGEKPSSFALGNQTVMLLFNQGTSSSSVRFLDLVSGEVSEEAITVFSGNHILDVCYQSGYYYLLVSNGSSRSVYKFDETDYSYEKINGLTPTNSASQITVDVFGNVFVAGDSVIYKHTKNVAYSSSSFASVTGVKKITTDLSGRLFVLNADGLGYIQSGNFVSVYKPTLTSSSIKSFALDFISSEVYFIYESEELLSKADGLDNLAISSVTQPSEYKTTGENSVNASDIKTYAPKDDANVYLVTPSGNKFEFVELLTEESDYVYICDIEVSSNLTLTALANKKGVVLINKTQLTEKKVTLTSAPKTAYITTGVNMYYLPVITKNSEFSLTTASNVIRLEKSTMINPEKTFTVLGREYYYATATVGGKTYTGFVPTAFTVEVLSENFTWNEYTLEKVGKGEIFTDQTLSEKFSSTFDGQEVKVIKIENEVAQIAFEQADGTISVGFISESLIKNPSSNWIKIVIVIMAVGVGILGTGLYLIYKKKK